MKKYHNPNYILKEYKYITDKEIKDPNLSVYINNTIQETDIYTYADAYILPYIIYGLFSNYSNGSYIKIYKTDIVSLIDTAFNKSELINTVKENAAIIVTYISGVGNKERENLIKQVLNLGVEYNTKIIFVVYSEYMSDFNSEVSLNLKKTSVCPECIPIKFKKSISPQTEENKDTVSKDKPDTNNHNDNLRFGGF